MIDQLLGRVRDGLARGAYLNERAVSTSIVVPILRALGWDDSDPEQVLPEHSTGRGRVDYALRCPPRSPLVFIEVKGVCRSVDADRQLCEYAFQEGVPLAVLTDGREWSFYLPGQQGSYSDRRAYQLVLDERDISDSASRLRRYLQRDRLASGEAHAAAVSDCQYARSRREAYDTMPKAWAELLVEPDGLLVDLLLERTEALCGYRPNQSEAEAFLQSQSSRSPDLILDRRSRQPVASPIAPNIPAQTMSESPVIERSESAARSGTITWRVGEDSGAAGKSLDAFVEYVESVFAQFPDSAAHIVAAARTRSRANIAATPEDIYPQRPDLGRNCNRRLANGLHLGTNLSNVEKLKLAKQIAAAVGLAFGTTAKLELPG